MGAASPARSGWLLARSVSSSCWPSASAGSTNEPGRQRPDSGLRSGPHSYSTKGQGDGHQQRQRRSHGRHRAHRLGGTYLAVAASGQPAAHPAVAARLVRLLRHHRARALCGPVLGARAQQDQVLRGRDRRPGRGDGERRPRRHRGVRAYPRPDGRHRRAHDLVRAAAVSWSASPTSSGRRRAQASPSRGRSCRCSSCAS